MPKETFFNLPEEKRHKIMDLAIEEFAAHGYQNASISHIARRAGIAKGSFYQYFENKLDLYTWLSEVAAQHELAVIEGATPYAPERVWEWLESMFFSGLKFAKEHPRLARIYQEVMAPTSVPELRAIHGASRAAATEYFVQIVDSAKEAGTMRPSADSGIAAHILLQVLTEGVREMLLARTGLDLFGALDRPEELQKLEDTELHEIVHAAVEILRHGLGG